MRRTRNPVQGFSPDEGSNPSLSAKIALKWSQKAPSNIGCGAFSLEKARIIVHDSSRPNLSRQPPNVVSVGVSRGAIP